MTRVLLIRDLAFADGTSPSLKVGLAVAVRDGHIAWIGPDEEADARGAEVIDGGGATLIPAMVDGHSHLVGQGGSHWRRVVGRRRVGAGADASSARDPWP